MSARLTVRILSQFDTFSYQIIGSNAGVRADLYGRSPSEVLLTDFFGGVSQVELSEAVANTTAAVKPISQSRSRSQEIKVEDPPIYDDSGDPSDLSTTSTPLSDLPERKSWLVGAVFAAVHLSVWLLSRSS